MVLRRPISATMGGFGSTVGFAENRTRLKKRTMCRKCSNPTCFGGCSQKDTPPANLTERDKERGGWNDQVSEDDLERIRQDARKAVEDPGAFTSNFNR